MNNLYLSRDLFYLAVCCFGFSIGCFLNFFISGLTSKQRNRMITAAILWISGMLVFLALALVFLKGKLFPHKGVYIVGGIIFVLTVVSCRFPKQFGLYFIIIAGFLTVAFAFFFLRFPSANETGPLVFQTDEPNGAAVRILRSSDNEHVREFAAFQLLNMEDPLIIDVYEFHIDEAIPFAGGQTRIAPVQIMQNGTIIFSNTTVFRIPFINLLKNQKNKSIISIKDVQLEFMIEEL